MLNILTIGLLVGIIAVLVTILVKKKNTSENYALSCDKLCIDKIEEIPYDVFECKERCSSNEKRCKDYCKKNTLFFESGEGCYERCLFGSVL